jgi:hypothetical protein
LVVRTMLVITARGERDVADRHGVKVTWLVSIGRLGWLVSQRVKVKRRLDVVVVGVTVVAAAQLQLHADSTKENTALEERCIGDEEVGAGDGVTTSIVAHSYVMRQAAARVWAR